jgi:hypothetical protein
MIKRLIRPNVGLCISAESRLFGCLSAGALPHRCCTRCTPLLSIFCCLLLSVIPTSSIPAVPIPARPLFMSVYVVQANQAEYNGIIIHSHHPQSPKTHAVPMQPQVQYKISHIYSVRPSALRSSPGERNDPSVGLYRGRPRRSR